MYIVEKNEMETEILVKKIEISKKRSSKIILGETSKKFSGKSSGVVRECEKIWEPLSDSIRKHSDDADKQSLMTEGDNEAQGAVHTIFEGNFRHVLVNCRVTSYQGHSNGLCQQSLPR